MAKRNVRKAMKSVTRLNSEGSAKSTQSKSRSGPRKSSGKSSSANMDFKGMLIELIGKPTVRSVAGGLATAFLTRLQVILQSTIQKSPVSSKKTYQS